MADNGQHRMDSTQWTQFYSSDYATAKERFVEAAKAVGGEVLSYQIGDDSGHAIDVSVLGDRFSRKTVVVSSGLHGVEGFFGSAVQLAWLRRIADRNHSSRIVFIHAINPVGFAKRRRWNEDNVDLNRNFVLATERYDGAPPSYAALDPLLNPKSPPSRWEPFVAKAMWQIVLRGMPALKQAVAGGQHEFPKGCFFGGREPCASTQIIQQHYADWVEGSDSVIHLDLHTGLGSNGACKLLLEETESSPAYQWFVETFGQSFVEASKPDAEAKAKGTAYATKGSMGRWLHENFCEDKRRTNRDCCFRFALAEFGTYGPLRVLSALRAENRAFFFADPDSAAARRSEEALFECFCPSSTRWRNQVTQTGIEIIQQAIHADQED
jgi:hypothetical protein